MAKHQRLERTLLYALLVGLFGHWLWWQAGTVPIAALPIADTHTVTVFLPGYRGNRLTFGPLVNRLVQAGVSAQATTIEIDRAGRRTIRGTTTFNGQNPLINVVFEANTDPQVELRQLTALLHWLRVHSGVTTVNLVGHSMGSNVAMQYLTTRHETLQPTVRHYVSIASEWYRPPDLTAMPKSLAALVIGGQILPFAGDGAVSLQGVQAMTRALKQAGVPTTEYIYHGFIAGASHSGLHMNPFVDAQLIQFLYQKTP